MKVNKFNKLILASAVSMAIAGPALAEESLQAVKVSRFEDKLMVNAIFSETDPDSTAVEVYVESSLLSSVNSLPTECDPISAFPTAEASSDNPSSELVGSWLAGDELELVDDEDDDAEDDDAEDDDGEDDDAEDDDGEDNDGEDDDSEDDDAEDDDGEDDDAEDDDAEDDDTEDDDGEDDDAEDDDDDAEENEQYYLTISADGFMVTSEFEMENGVGTCEVTYVGELVGDTYTAATTM